MMPNSPSFSARTDVQKATLSSAVKNTARGSHPELSSSSLRLTRTSRDCSDCSWTLLVSFIYAHRSEPHLSRGDFLLTSASRGRSLSTSLCLAAQRRPATTLPGGFVAKENENTPLRNTLPASRVIYGRCWMHASLTDVKGSSPECLLIREGGKIQTKKKWHRERHKIRGGSLGSSSSAGSQDLLNYCHLPISQVSKHGEGEVKRCSRLHLLTDF